MGVKHGESAARLHEKTRERIVRAAKAGRIIPEIATFASVSQSVARRVLREAGVKWARGDLRGRRPGQSYERKPLDMGPRKLTDVEMHWRGMKAQMRWFR